uniref:NADH-ubiquinone oxidoreductase chain 2 n=1 Tax=Rectidens sumatrensis TaxID=1903498 RepID=A0A8A3WFX2_9BIVA|nr:NADH dehydrogenase subunit 2 [Rectidens sumatrensis]
MKTNIPIFTTMLTLTSLISLTSTNSFFVWTMLELNMLSFIPLLSTSNSTPETEASIKYIIPQAFASSLFMTSTILMNLTPNFNILTTLALIMKLGGAPLHTWFPAVMQSTNLPASLILTTWQKLAPLLLMTTKELSFTPAITLSAITSAMWGSMAGLNQTNLLKLMAFSSINHLGWLMMASLFNPLTAGLYLLLYSLTVFPIFIILNYLNTKSYNMTILKFQTTQQWLTIILMMLSLAGLPPMPMFMMKLQVITLMISKPMLIQLTIMLLGTTISLYFYLSLTISLMLNQITSLTTPTTTKSPNSLLHTTLLILQLTATPIFLMSIP